MEFRGRTYAEIISGEHAESQVAPDVLFQLQVGAVLLDSYCKSSEPLLPHIDFWFELESIVCDIARKEGRKQPENHPWGAFKCASHRYPRAGLVHAVDRLMTRATAIVESSPSILESDEWDYFLFYLLEARHPSVSKLLEFTPGLEDLWREKKHEIAQRKNIHPARHKTPEDHYADERMARMAQRDSRALAELHVLYDSFVAFVVRDVLDEKAGTAAVDDVVARVFELAWKHAYEWVPIAKVKAWLGKAARRLAINELTRHINAKRRGAEWKYTVLPNIGSHTCNIISGASDASNGLFRDGAESGKFVTGFKPVVHKRQRVRDPWHWMRISHGVPRDKEIAHMFYYYGRLRPKKSD
jgi:hypothetical protein